MSCSLSDVLWLEGVGWFSPMIDVVEDGCFRPWCVCVLRSKDFGRFDSSESIFDICEAFRLWEGWSLGNFRRRSSSHSRRSRLGVPTPGKGSQLTLVAKLLFLEAESPVASADSLTGVKHVLSCSS